MNRDQVYMMDALERHVEQLERILDALREPTDGVCVAALETLFQGHDNAMISAAETIRAAVAAAEREVGA